MPSSTQRAIWLIGAFAALASQPAAAEAPAFSSPRKAAVLEAGATVSVAWSISAGAVSRYEEMELILSLDGARSFPIRVTRNLPPETSAFAWRVPALPTAHARLALRTGEDGDEQIELVGEEFSIEIGPGTPLEPTTRVAGEWRTRDALEDGSGSTFPDPAASAGAAGSIGRIPRLAAVLTPKPAPSAVAAPGRNRRAETATSLLARPPRPTLPRTPSAAPLRA